MIFDIYYFYPDQTLMDEGGRALQGHDRDDVSHGMVRRVMWYGASYNVQRGQTWSNTKRGLSGEPSHKEKTKT